MSNGLINGCQMVGSAGVNSVVSVALVSITGRYYSAIGIISDAKVIMTSGSNTDKQKNGKHAGFNGRKRVFGTKTCQSAGMSAVQV